VWISAEAEPLPDRNQAIDDNRKFEMGWGPDQHRLGLGRNQSFLFDLKNLLQLPEGSHFGADPQA